jgi:hypothetical protein
MTKNYIKYISKQFGMSALVFFNDMKELTHPWSMILMDDDSNKQVTVMKCKTFDEAIDHAKECVGSDWVLDGIHPTNFS